MNYVYLAYSGNERGVRTNKFTGFSVRWGGRYRL